jgi:hypothetical protein
MKIKNYDDASIIAKILVANGYHVSINCGEGCELLYYTTKINDGWEDIADEQECIDGCKL